MRVVAFLSIRAKLIATVMLTTCTALFLAGGALVLYQARAHRAALVQDLRTVADMVGQILPATLIFERADSAETALAALKSQGSVLSACLYDSRGELFADYFREGPPACPPHPSRDESGFVADHFVLYHPVGDEERLGSLRIVASLGQLRERIRIFGTALVFVLLASALAALALSSWLQGFFSRPITDLAETAKGVSQTHDYTLRAPKHAEDEVGVAVEAFNEMLARIEGALSERKRAEEALLALNTTLEERVAERTAAAEQKTAELQRSNQELEQFAYVASHDLQEPLRAVRSFTQLIEERIRPTLDSETTVYFDQVLGGVARMHALINDLLSYARVGRTTLTRGRVDFGAVLEAALADLGPSLKECDGRVMHGPMPVVVGDGDRLGQLIRNLITNAIRFRSSEPPRIEISAERRGDGWQFAVRDNGIGIDPRHHERIFVIFQRLHGRDRPGTGIGLAICRKIVEMYGGKIWVQSELGKGATFFFTLPA